MKNPLNLIFSKINEKMISMKRLVKDQRLFDFSNFLKPSFENQFFDLVFKALVATFIFVCGNGGGGGLWFGAISNTHPSMVIFVPINACHMSNAH
jgi:hypothetical protein